MSKQRWLVLYIGKTSDQRAAIVTPMEPEDFPLGVNEFELGLDDYDGEPLVFVELPDDPDFRPTIVDGESDQEVAIQFIDL